MKASGYLTIFCSIFIALLLSILPVPDWLSDIWPAWLLATLCYWVLALPHRVGLWTTFISGILVDTLNNSLFGEHAVALLIAIYFMFRIHRQIRFFPGWQQVVVIMLLTLIYQACLQLVQIILKTPMPWLDFFLPILSTGLIWPIVYNILRYYRQKYRIT